jgi:hypothetical protein
MSVLDYARELKAIQQSLRDGGSTGSYPEVAKVTGQTPKHVQDSMSVLMLPIAAQSYFEEDSALSVGHAVVLRGLKEQAAIGLIERAMWDKWSVSRVRIEAQKLKKAGGGENPVDMTDADIRRLEERAMDWFLCKVDIRQNKTDGAVTMTMKAYDVEQFQGVLERMGVVESDW